jgi:hypothetical protein
MVRQDQFDDFHDVFDDEFYEFDGEHNEHYFFDEYDEFDIEFDEFEFLDEQHEFDDVDNDNGSVRHGITD